MLSLKNLKTRFSAKEAFGQYVGPTMICGKSDESANPSQIGSSPSCQWAFQVTCADHATNRTQGIYEEKKLPPWMVGLVVDSIMAWDVVIIFRTSSR